MNFFHAYKRIRTVHFYSYVVLFAGVVAAAKPKLAVFLKYAKVELTPPTPGEIPQIKTELGSLVKSIKGGKWKELTVKEAWLNTLIGVEVLMWFYVGECIGKRNIIGYKV